MELLKKPQARRYVRKEGITSYLLASPITCGASYLTTSVVEIEPGGYQRLHSHVPEQIYYVLEGSGSMSVGHETRRVVPGDCIFIPSNTPHGLKNENGTVLKYFSAAAPAFAAEELEGLWPLLDVSDGSLCSEK